MTLEHAAIDDMKGFTCEYNVKVIWYAKSFMFPYFHYSNEAFEAGWYK